MEYETEEQYHNVDITVLVTEEEQKNLYFNSPGRVEKPSELDRYSIPKRCRHLLVQTGYYVLSNQ